MKNTKLNKALITVLCFAIAITMSATVLATSAGTSIGGVVINPVKDGEGATSATNIGNKILGIIQVVGIILSVGCLMVLGIKYMMGSAEEKAEYKKTFIPYLVGALLLFAASALANTIYKWVTGIAAA